MSILHDMLLTSTLRKSGILACLPSGVGSGGERWRQRTGWAAEVSLADCNFLDISLTQMSSSGCHVMQAWQQA